MHLQAQYDKKDLNTINDGDFDELELNMLKEFYDYVENHMTYYWVHWNMRNASYGFEAIANRFRILGGVPLTIDDDLKFDLPNILGLLYTYNFVAHKPNGQLINITKFNAISTRDALTGKEEADAFENREYLKLHMSTMRKVEMIDRVIKELEIGNLKVESKMKDIYGLSVRGIIEIVKNTYWLFLLWSIIIFVIGSAFEPIIQKIFGTSP